MWPYINNRLIGRLSRPRPQRDILNETFKIRGYCTSKCELEIRYYLGYLIIRALRKRYPKRNTKFMFRNKLNHVSSFYSRRLNSKLDHGALISYVVKNDKEALHKLRRTTLSLSKPCEVCGGCYSCTSGGAPICPKADLSIRRKYGVFRGKFELKKSSNKSLQHHSGTSCLRWTVFKSRFYGFAAQKCSIKPQLKNCR